jgi:hypothetical protein
LGEHLKAIQDRKSYDQGGTWTNAHWEFLELARRQPGIICPGYPESVAMSHFPWRPRFSLRSFFVSIALIAAYLGGRMPLQRMLHQVESERDLAIAKREMLLDQIERWRQFAYGPCGNNSTWDHGPVPIIEVTDKYVVIAVGFDDGAKDGLVFDVRNKGSAVGSIAIIKALGDRSIAKPLRDKDMERISKGDFAHFRH